MSFKCSTKLYFSTKKRLNPLYFLCQVRKINFLSPKKTDVHRRCTECHQIYVKNISIKRETNLFIGRALSKSHPLICKTPKQTILHSKNVSEIYKFVSGAICQTEKKQQTKFKKRYCVVQLPYKKRRNKNFPAHKIR